MARRTVNPAPSFTKASSGILIDSTMGILTFEEMLTLQAAAELPTLPDLTRKKRRAARAVTMVRGLSASGRRPGRKAGGGGEAGRARCELGPRRRTSGDTVWKRRCASRARCLGAAFIRMWSPTVAKASALNGWGLYDVLGNLEEWIVESWRLLPELRELRGREGPGRGEHALHRVARGCGR